MRKLAIALLIVAASASYADKVKSKAPKEKRFEPAVKAAAEYAGSYRGPSESYGLILEVHGGKLSGNYVELGRVAVLDPLTIDGANFSTTASFDDGSSRTIKGSFANRVLNGDRAFGVRMEDVPVEGYGAINTFFERME